MWLITNINRQTESTDADAKKDELMRLVSHYLVYVGQKCLLLPPEWDGETAIDLAKRKQPAFTWKIMIHPWYMTSAARSASIEILKGTKCANDPRWADIASYEEIADVMGNMLALAQTGSIHCASDIKDERGSPSDAAAPVASAAEEEADWSQCSGKYMVPHTVCTNCTAMILV